MAFHSRCNAPQPLRLITVSASSSTTTSSTGRPVTRNMEIALQRTLEATPEPRVVVAVGACGCSGGIFGEGTYASRGGVDRVVPVDVYVPGCPPSPHAVLAGLFVAMGIREARARPDAGTGSS